MLYLVLSFIFLFYSFLFRSKLIYLLLCAALCIFISIGTWVNSERLKADPFEISNIKKYQLHQGSTFIQKEDGDFRIFPFDNSGKDVKFTAIPKEYIEVEFLPKDQTTPEFLEIIEKKQKVNPFVYFDSFYSQPNVFKLYLYNWPKEQ